LSLENQLAATFHFGITSPLELYLD